MPERQPNETLDQYAIRTAYEYGHFWGADNPNGWNIRQDDLPNLRITDPVVIQALRSLSLADPIVYTRKALDAHGRIPDFDGILGPAMSAYITDPAGRCPIPDNAPPPGVEFNFSDPYLQQVVTRMQADAAFAAATGPGNWRSCHGIGNAHCATVRVNETNLPSFLRPVFTEVLTKVQKAYADVGLLFRFLDQNRKDLLNGEQIDSTVNIEMSFVTSSDGWIGLAILGTNQTCSSNIWCRFLATYKGGTSNAAIVQQWVTLIKHELGHNCRFNHTRGGVMNPSIVNGLPTEWVDSDPLTPSLKQEYGGVAVKIPGAPDPGPDPNPPSPPNGSIEQKLFEVQLKNIVQDTHLKWLTDKVNYLLAR